MIRLSTIDGTKGIVFDNNAYILNSKDFGAAKTVLSTSASVNKIGRTINDRTLGERNIEIVGYVIANSREEMRERKRKLETIINPFSDFYIIIDDEFKLRASAETTINYASEGHIHNDSLTKFIINGYCANPCFTSIDDTIVTLEGWKQGFPFPMNISAESPWLMGYKASAQNSNVHNPADLPVGIEIKFKALTDGVKNPYVVNTSTNEKIMLTCQMKENEEIIINTTDGNKKVTQIYGGVENPYFQAFDIDSSFIQLQCGDNQFVYGAESCEDALIAEIKFTPLYLGV